MDDGIHFYVRGMLRDHEKWGKGIVFRRNGNLGLNKRPNI